MNEATATRVSKNGKRYYKIEQYKAVRGVFPSITTILGETSDKSGLDKWKKRVGVNEAKKISRMSMNRGTVMHRLVELYKVTEGEKSERIKMLESIASGDAEIQQFDQEFIEAGWFMFYRFWNNHEDYFDRIKRVLESETFLWSERFGYAGTVDNVSELIDNRIVVIDYKNSRKPKQERWIEDYYLQLSAYFIAYYERTGIMPDGCELWIANEADTKPQLFTLTREDIKVYFIKFTKRLNTFNKINS